MPKSAFHVAAKSIDDQTVKGVTTAITTGHAVTYAGGQVAAAAASPRGIAKVDAAIGSDCLIGVMGTVPAKAGAAVAVGAALTTDSTGRMVTATTGQPIFARALQASLAANDFIEILITREGLSA